MNIIIQYSDQLLLFKVYSFIYLKCKVTERDGGRKGHTHRERERKGRREGGREGEFFICWINFQKMITTKAESG